MKHPKLIITFILAIIGTYNDGYNHITGIGGVIANFIAYFFNFGLVIFIIWFFYVVIRDMDM